MPLNPFIPKTDAGDAVAVDNNAGEALAVDVATSVLPTGASTSANQATEIASLSSIDSKLTSPITITGTVTANLGTIDGAATAANQTTANSSLSSIDGKLTSPITVTGPLTDTQLRATPVPVSGPLTDTQLRATPVPVSGTVTATTGTSATSTLTNVASSATNVTLLASNASRKKAMIYNDSTKILYVKFGTTASLTSFTVAIDNKGYFEFPTPTYTGQIDGIWSAANGTARITELT